MTPAATEIEVGRAFDVTVVRRWSRDFEPDPWTDETLSPLVVKKTGTERRIDDQGVEETRSFRAYAFAPGSVTVPSFSFRAVPKSGGPARVATCPGFTVQVKTTLDRKAPGPPELPGDPPAEPRRVWMLLAAATAILAGVAWLLLVARKSRPSVPRPDVRSLSADDRALASLELLRTRDADSQDEVRAFHRDLSGFLREWIAGRFGIHALEMTTEELLDSGATAAAFPGAERARLFEVLGASDLVKFAGHASTKADRSRLIEEAETVVRSRRA